MNLTELLRSNRSYRRFHEDQPVDEGTLRGLVERTRLCPSSANRQPLKYLLACAAEDRAKIFPHLAWAGALADWPGPAEGERPAGYIVVLGDIEISATFHVDSGIAAQSILLAAVEQGLGGCMVGSIDRDGLRKALRIPERFAIALVIALGKPQETVVLEDARGPADVVYWRDQQGVHHVPKRPLEELLVKF
jgi:nitroreductase